MRVLSVVSECAPLVKTGGLADVAGALPGALAAEGARMRVLMPAYRGLAGRLTRKRATEVETPFGAARLLEGVAEGLDLILIESELFDQEGGPYLDAERRDWADNHLRFGLLGWMGAHVAARGLGRWRPDVAHAHDWQAGLTPTYLRMEGAGAPPCVITVHNIAFQGLFAASTHDALGLPAEFWSSDHVEFWGHVGFLKAGLLHADAITTVSPTYARELLTPRFGEGLDGLLRHRRDVLEGILNGIDTAVWDPETDRRIAARYSDSEGKAGNRAALAEAFGVAAPQGAPLFGVVTRMTRQKGLDLLFAALPGLLERGAGLVVLGSGEEGLEAAFLEAARDHPGRVGVRLGYDEDLAHLVQAGADSVLVPSRFEPCGLTQLCALRYGALPVVARTGGLADTVIDANAAAMRAGVATGFMHEAGDAEALGEAIGRACDVHGRPEAWRGMQANAMSHPVGWQESARRYMALYRRLAPGAR
ncbi:MAG: glycogen synthase GlgA [Pseudomonadota bacterium]